jgi:membrane-associated phospholipid phosphatase
VASGAHFLSDIVVAAIIGWVVGAWVWTWRDPVLVPDAGTVDSRPAAA